jgi:hypothetical protein
MVKIERISAGAVVTVLRNGERITLFEKQLISYDEADTMEVTGGEVMYSVNESEVFTKSSDTAPAVPQTTEEPKLPDTEEAPKEVTEKAVEETAPVIIQPAAKTAKAK